MQNILDANTGKKRDFSNKREITFIATQRNKNCSAPIHSTVALRFKTYPSLVSLAAHMLNNPALIERFNYSKCGGYEKIGNARVRDKIS